MPAGAPSAVTDPADRLQRLARHLARAVRGDVRFDPVSRVLYSTDASIYQILPLGVVIPRDADDVAV